MADISKITATNGTTYDIKDAGAARSNHTHTTSIAASSGTSQVSLSANTKYSITAGGTSYIFTTPAHQDISGKADKASITAGTAGTSSATSGSTLAVPYVTMNAQGIVTGYGTHTHTVTGFASSSHTHSSVVDSGDSTKTVSFGYSKADYGDASYIAVWNGSELRTLSKGSVCSLIDASPVGHTHNYAGLASGQSAGGKAASAAVADSANAVAWANVSGKPSFATVATSGSYTDLSNKPTIPAAQVQTDWNATSGMGVLLNKPSSLPASDVYSWAKQSTKPSYNFGEIGAGVATIGDGANRLMFRTNASYLSGIYYSTPGNESLVFANGNQITSWIFATANPTSGTSWQSLTPSLQIKNQRVAINKLIANGTDAAYNLDVNGTANATTLYENGTSLASKYLGISAKAASASSADAVAWGNVSGKPSFATVATSGSYTDLSNKPTIPTVNNSTITIKQTGISDQTFTLNGSAKTITLVDNNTWRPIGTGATDAAAGNHTHGISFGDAGSSSTDYVLSANTRYKLTAGGSDCIIQTPPNVDISGKADKASITAGTAGTSSATSGSTLAVPYVTMNAQGIVTGYGTHTHTITGFASSSHTHTTVVDSGDSTKTVSFGYSKADYTDPAYFAVWNGSELRTLSKNSVCSVIGASTTDTKNTAGSTNSGSKLYLIGATSQAANPQTYSNSSVYATDGVLHCDELYVTDYINVDGDSLNDYVRDRAYDETSDYTRPLLYISSSSTATYNVPSMYTGQIYICYLSGTTKKLKMPSGGYYIGEEILRPEEYGTASGGGTITFGTSYIRLTRLY